MLLQQIQHFNDLSPQLRTELTNKINGFGKTVRYKFEISNPNPDPTFHDGKILFPHIWTLDPAVFSIMDKEEKRDGKQPSKRIALIDALDEKGMPNKFRKIKLHERDRGILRLELHDNPEHFDIAMFLELHPKLKEGKFLDKTKLQMITRIDEQAAATEERAIRTARNKAMNVAENLTDKEVVNFADAMLWEEGQDPIVLRNQIEKLAETDSVFFNDLVAGKKIEYQAAVKQAMNKKIIAFDPAEFKFTWTGNNQTIVMLSNVAGKNHVEQLAEWFANGGEKAGAAYNKIKELIK